MKLTLIKEAIQENALFEAEDDEKEQEVVNDEETTEESGDIIDNALDPEETTGLDIPEEPVDLGLESTNDTENEQPLESENTDKEKEENEISRINVLNSLINSYWGIIDQLKFIKLDPKFINTEPNIDAFNKIIESLIDDTTINVGMLYKLIQLCNPEVNVLIDKGINKADEKILNNEE